MTVSPKRDIAVFCDVDDVLTDVPINVQLAVMLGVESQLKRIEDTFFENGSTAEFNRDFIPLFRGAGFNRTKAEECFSRVQLRNRASELLLLKGVDTYLVSSGPSYYIDILANTHSIDIETRCKHSRYEFEDDGTLSSTRYTAVGDSAKKAFVRNSAREYKLTVGIGNNPLLDGPFLALCTIPILVGRLEKGFLCVNELDPVIDLITGLTESDPLE